MAKRLLFFEIFGWTPDFNTKLELAKHLERYTRRQRSA
jgi:hypothetical protein